MYSERLRYLANTLLEKNIDGIALNAGPNLTYLTGLHFHLSERPVVLLVCPDKEPIIILPELEREKLKDTDFPLRSYPYPEDPAHWQDVFGQATRSLSLVGGNIGIEPRWLRLLEYNYLINPLAETTFVDASDILASFRAVKNPQEINLIKKAVQIAQEALAATLPLVKIGMTEKELAGELVIQLFRHGSDPALPFSPIVCTGPNSANPHAQPSERRLNNGDLLIIDWGAAWQGYVSDLTRTFAIGTVDREYEFIHNLVQKANAAGRNAGKPGAPCKSVDKAARKIIEDGGYGPFFNHRTGHGLGMECHEDPYIRSDNDQFLVKGMTYTIEPGIYLAGRNGVRIEDDVVITANGTDSLSDFPREIQVIG